MDAERAETHLRMLAEAELRRVAGLNRGVSSRTARTRHVADALIAVGALDAQRAEDLLTGLDLALAVRQAGHGRTAFFAHHPRVRQTARIVSPHTPVTPPRVVPVGMMVPLRRFGVHGELYLLAYARTSGGARFSMYARERGVPGVDPLMQLTATDDQGARYSVWFTGSGHPQFRAGVLRLDPDPPPDIRWLDLIVGDGVTRRISLEPPPHPPRVTMTEASHSPGEYLLHAVAAGILGGRPGRPAEPWPGDFGEIVEALIAAGALSPLSPLPGQLVTLCESLDVRDHGIAAPAARDLPAPWHGLLTHAIRRKRDNSPPRGGCAAAALTLPELDGLTLSVLGLHSDEDGTVLHVHASGVAADADPAGFFPVLWLRDDSGRWHTARDTGWSYRDAGERAALLPVTPPLQQATSLEITAAGRTAEVRTTLPLSWR
ncbi:MAG TPA: hypothetical protein VFB06_06005 [Streptosporangiaceae bacterium]|nr:hypothetical protein [Streptosporangiaceae bacterium]